MNYKNQLVKNGLSFFVLIACLLLFVGINSCNSEADQSTATNTASATGTDTAKANTAAVSVNLPEYVINATDLPAIGGGGGNPIPSKFLIKFEITNAGNPLSTMNLLLYPANDHAHYGQGTNPIRITPDGTIRVDVTNLVLGNNEIATEDLVLRPHNEYYFHHLKLTPKLDERSHLVFSISAYSNADALIKDKDKKPFTIPDTNPCPPNQPKP